MSGQRYRVVFDNTQVQVPMTGEANGLCQTTTLAAGSWVPHNVPADKLAHLLSMKMIEPVDVEAGAAVEAA